MRPAWGVYLAKTTAIIFVVDSADITQLDHAANELKLLLDFEDLRELRDVPLLVFANKQDLEGAKSPVEISEALNLGELGHRRWNIAPCSVIDGVGISGGMDWLLVSAFHSQYRSQSVLKTKLVYVCSKLLDPKRGNHHNLWGKSILTTLRVTRGCSQLLTNRITRAMEV